MRLLLCFRTYAFCLVNFANTPHRFRRADNGGCLDRNPIAEAGSLAVDDAGDVDVSFDTEPLAGFDYLVVGADGLANSTSALHS